MSQRIDPDLIADHVADVIPLTRPRPREVGEDDEIFNTETAITSPPADAEIPFYLLEVPGLVGHIARFITKTSRYPQPLLSLGAALALVGTAAGRKYAGPTKSGTHLYLLTLAPTGAGKAHPAKMVRRLLRAANMPEMMGPGRFQSETAVYQVAAAQPQMLCIMDEFGSYLQKINDPRSGSSHEKAISGALRSFWGASFDTIDPPAWAASSNTKLQPIHSPALSVLGMSVHEEFYAALQSADIANGFLNRFLVLPTQNKPEEVDPELDDDAMTPALIEGIQRVAVQAPGRTGDEWQAETRLDWESSTARLAYATFRKSVAQHAEGGKLLSRTAEMAVRLATIRAIGRQVMKPSAPPSVSLEDINWGCELALWSGQRMVDDAASYMVESDHQGRANEVLRHIKAARRMTHTELNRKVKHKFDARTLRMILDGLRDADQIEIVRVTTKGASKPTDTIIYRG